jgi:hypothetical protein
MESHQKEKIEKRTIKLQQNQLAVRIMTSIGTRNLGGISAIEL